MLAQFRQFWTNLNSGAKAVYGATAVLLLAVVGGVGFWSSQTQYVPLYNKELPAEVAAEMVQKLDADRVSYKLSSDGTSILVPTETAQKVRMNLLVAGLPSGGGKGYELFDTMSMGATPFMQTINLGRATQGELQRTIMSLEPVLSARVHIAQPNESAFVREKEPVKASVTIKTKPGATLSRGAVDGIVKLMAFGVKGLTTENVEVIDSDGSILTTKKDPRGGMASGDQLLYQREVESHLANNAQEILAKTFGPGRAVVKVTADMSFRHLKETSEKFDPDGKVLQHEKGTTSKMSSAGGARGTAGATSNIPPGQNNVTAAAVPGPNKDEEQTESDYLVSRVNQEKVEQQGVIDRLTVAVIIVPKKVEGDAPEDASGISLDDVRELVKQAVSFKTDRGDQIQVSVGKALGEAAAPAEAAFADNKEIVAMAPFGNDFVSVVRGSSLGVAGLIALAITVKLLRRRPTKSPTPSPAFAGLSLDSRQVPEELTDLHAVAATIKAWLEEPSVIRFEPNAAAKTPLAKPA